MRISRNMVYAQNINGMNRSLSEYMRLVEQNSSQQRINRPSDDPGGFSQVINLNSHLSRLEQYEDNIDLAEGWLTLADDELRQASDILTRYEELAEQASSGTLSADQRSMIADEARQLMHQLLAISNTEYAGDSIFAGSEVNGNAFELGLSATVRDAQSDPSVTVRQVTGSAEYTVYAEFTQGGTVGTDALEYRYTLDGGTTWQTGTLAAGETTLDFGTSQAELEAGGVVSATAEAGESTGTAMWLRPAAYYKGDTEDGETVVHYGDAAVSATAEGYFSGSVNAQGRGAKGNSGSVAIRIDSDATLSGPIAYSYSLDNGANWVSGNEGNDGQLSVPGGYLTLASNGGNALAAGEQFIITPDTAGISVDVGVESSVQINSVGSDIFGGLYTPAGSAESISALADTPQRNMFEVVGAFIGYLETNDQDGVSESLDALSEVHDHLATALGEIGGREVRLEFARSTVEMGKESATASISSIEDANMTQLATDLARAEYIYQAVLKTSSDIMNISLLDYI